MKHIALDEALGRLGNSEKLYCKLVKGFIEKYQFVIGDFEVLIKIENYEEARRLAHSIKGLCGNLGANQLTVYSKELEYAFRDELGNYEALLKAFGDELKEVIWELNDLKERHELENCDVEIQRNSNQITLSEYNEYLRQLYEALNLYKYSDIKHVYNTIRQYEIPQLYLELMPTVFDAIEHFDYKVAAGILESQLI